MKFRKELLESLIGDYTLVNEDKILDNHHPKKTIKAYKLCNLKNGKLYPLYVNAKVPFPMKKWIEAEAGETNEKGRVKANIGSNGLAYRPGFHASEYPIALHIGGKYPTNSKKPTYRKKNQVWVEVEFDSTKDYMTDMEKNGQKEINDRVPVNGVYWFKTNANAVSRWLIGGTMRINRILTDEEVKEINAKVGLADLPRLEELMEKQEGEEQMQEDARYRFKKALHEALMFNESKDFRFHGSKVKNVANRYEIGVEFMDNFEYSEDILYTSPSLFIQNGEKSAIIDMNFFAWLKNGELHWDADLFDNEWNSDGHVLEDIFEEAGVDQNEVEEIGMDLLRDIVEGGLDDKLLDYLEELED